MAQYKMRRHSFQQTVPFVMPVRIPSYVLTGFCEVGMKIISILGTSYTIEERTVQEDANLKDADAYCDRTTNEIVVLKFPDDECTIHDPEWYRKKLLRHEIVHAFLFESGLGECSNWKQDDSQHSEQIVDWIAIQFPKMQKVFEEVGCL